MAIAQGERVVNRGIDSAIIAIIDCSTIYLVFYSIVSNFVLNRYFIDSMYLLTLTLELVTFVIFSILIKEKYIYIYNITLFIANNIK